MAMVRGPQSFTGRLAGTEFVNGEGVTENPGALAYFRRKDGFEVVVEKTADEAPEKEAPKPRRRRTTPTK